MTTKPQPTTEPPDQIWLTVFEDKKEPRFVMVDWHKPDIRNTQLGDYVAIRPHHKVEYAPVSRHYFCSCGGALTAEEYITHYFELGHDRGDHAVAASAAPVVDDNEAEPLTDAEVDAWLEAHKNDPIDPAQANRVEWLFRKKLAASIIDKATEWLRSYDERIAQGGKGAQDMERIYGEEAAFHREVIRAVHTLALEPSSAAATAAPADHDSIPLTTYERMLTIEWDKYNARRHELIKAERSRVLSEAEVLELFELQWLARIKHGVSSGPRVTQKQPLPDRFLCINPEEQPTVINFLRGYGTDADRELARLHLNLCLRCQELATAAPVDQSDSSIPTCPDCQQGYICEHCGKSIIDYYSGNEGAR